MATLSKNIHFGVQDMREYADFINGYEATNRLLSLAFDNISKTPAFKTSEVESSTSSVFNFTGNKIQYEVVFYAPKRL